MIRTQSLRKHKKSYAILMLLSLLPGCEPSNRSCHLGVILLKSCVL